MALFGLFGGDSPAATATAQSSGPRWWDYGFGLLGGYAPSAVNQVFKDRQIAEQDRAQQAALKQYLYGQAFGSDIPGVTGSARPAGNFGGVPAVASVSPSPSEVLAASAQGTQASPGLTASAAPAITAAQNGMVQTRNNLLYNTDGSLRSRQELLADPRWVALQSDPTAAAFLKTYDEAAAARAPKWDFQNGQYNNVNSDDPSMGSRRIGTAVDNTTGIYTDVGPDGRLVAKTVVGFNPAQAANIASKKGAENAAELDLYGQKKGVDLNYDPRIQAAKDAAAAQIRRQYEPGTAGAIAAAQEAAKAPYAIETVQGPNGPVTGTRAQIAAQLGQGGLIQGRSDSSINAANALTESDLDAIRTYKSNNSLYTKNLDKLATGKLNLNIATNAINTGLNTIGISTPESANYASFVADMNKIRNQTLLLQKGTQTEGDAQRALDELFSNFNSEKVVSQRLSELKALNDQAIAERQKRIQSRQVGGTIPAPVAAPATGGYTLQQIQAERARRGY